MRQDHLQAVRVPVKPTQQNVRRRDTPPNHSLRRAKGAKRYLSVQKWPVVGRTAIT